MNSVEWNPKYNLLAYAGDDKNKYQADDGMAVAVHSLTLEFQKATLLPSDVFDSVTLQLLNSSYEKKRGNDIELERH